MSGAVRAAILLLVLVALWWIAGLDRLSVDPRRFFTVEQIARADAYHGPRYVGVLLGLALGLGALALLAFTSLGDRLLAPVRSWPWPVGIAAAGAVVVGFRALLRLPVAFWQGHLHERAWGFSTQSAGGWLGDWAKGLGIGIVLTAVTLVVLVGIVRGFPRAWPAIGAAVAVVLTVALSFAGPLVLEPAFNRFRPLQDEALVADLRALASRAGVPVRDVLVSDASRRTTKENAYVSGFGATRRLVLFDTLLERSSPDEVRLVVAHELGHRRLRHVEILTLAGALSAAAAVLVLWLLFRWGVLRGPPTDPRVLPAVLLAFAVVSLAVRPFGMVMSRTLERSADRFALELTAEPDAYVSMERGLALRNLSELDPGPVAYRFLFTHPSPGERIVIARGG